MSDHYVCSVCGNRIHRSRVPNSLTGDVMCCGQRMTAPGDVITAVLTVVWIAFVVLGTWLLRTRAEWGWGGAIFVAAVGALAVVFIAGPPLAAFIDKRSR